MSIVDRFGRPFRNLVIASICWSVTQGLLQIRWTAIRYRTFGGHRPPLAQVFLGGQGILLMLVVAVGYILICDEDRKRSATTYWLGMLAAVGCWISACFLLQG